MKIIAYCSETLKYIQRQYYWISVKNRIINYFDKKTNQPTWKRAKNVVLQNRI